MRNARRRNAQDTRCENMRPGDWVQFRGRESGAYFTEFENKIARIKEWDEDGHNGKRAWRNKKVVVEIEPHLHSNPRTFRTSLKEFVPLNPMLVIALAASEPK